MDRQDETHAITLGASVYTLLAATLLCLAAVPFCWWLADQRLIPWREDARWIAVRSAEGRTFQSIAPTAFIEMSRESCFGFCPVYRVKLFASGRVEYRGEKYVCAVGEHSAQVDPRASTKLIADLASAGFFTLEWIAEYTWSDSSTVHLRLQVGDRTRSIDHYLGDEVAPRVLNEMEEAIDEIAGAGRWLPLLAGRNRYCLTAEGERIGVP